MKFDLNKYGFEIDNSRTGNLKFFIKKIDDKTFVELTVLDDIYSLSHYDMQFDKSPELVIACRYKVETQEQLDFLIYNGRIGYLFK